MQREIEPSIKYVQHIKNLPRSHLLLGPWLAIKTLLLCLEDILTGKGCKTMFAPPPHPSLLLSEGPTAASKLYAGENSDISNL
jgi:hypothetical protein